MEEMKDIAAQIEELSSTRPIFYMKFCSTQERAESVINGDFYVNTPEFFRQQEMKTGERGQGDRNELIMELSLERGIIKNHSTGNVVLSFPKGIARIRYDYDDNFPMVCMVGIPTKDLKPISITDNFVNFGFPFSEEEYLEMEKKFGKYCVLIGARELEEKIRRACARANIDYIFEPVKYVPLNSLEKFKAYQKGDRSRFLFKDEDLDYQREYRLVLGEEFPKDHFFHIGRLESACIVQADELQDMEIGFQCVFETMEEENGTEKAD